jgi:hypothetical protein
VAVGLTMTARKNDSSRSATPPQVTPRSTEAAVKVSTAIGIVAAMVIAVLVNVVVARHYARWDWTRGGLYTLSDATVETLHGLSEPIVIHVLLSTDDPLELSVRQLLSAYQAETDKLEVRTTDPDRAPAEFLAVQQKYGIVAGRTEDGRIVTDAAIVIVKGDDPFFLTPDDLVEVESADEMRARPRLEEALTGGIRNVLGSESPLVCFSRGHGELPLDFGGTDGLAELRDRLVKNNYRVAEIPTHQEEPTGDPLEGCAVVAVIRPTTAMPDEDAERIERFIEAGGSALFAIGPVPSESGDRLLDLRLDELTALGGVRVRADVVYEQDPTHRNAVEGGAVLLPNIAAHPITAGMQDEAERGLVPMVALASSIEPSNGAIASSPLLVTTEEAFAIDDLTRASPPEAKPGDPKGPIAVATAAERPPLPGKDRGARIVVLSSHTLVMGAIWRNPEFRANAILVGNAMSWLASERTFLDIPPKEAYVAGLSMDEETMSGIFRYVVIYMPLATLLFGVAIHLRRQRSRRGKPASDA